mmetsp:Transcript_34371/g.91980  ORF Transcript_34371/g.91980 Transcript_34371/m.91980 type:complete len:93 (-) Transcript_34371:2064-2342(-)
MHSTSADSECQTERVCPVDPSYADLFHDTNWAGAVKGFITNASKNVVSGHELQFQNTSNKHFMRTKGFPLEAFARWLQPNHLFPKSVTFDHC